MDVFITTVILGLDPRTSDRRDHPIKSDDDARWKGTAQ